MKLLIVRLSALGDVVHTLPALELLRRALPDAELTWVVEAFAAPLLEGHPALDRVVVLDRRAATRGPHRFTALRQLGSGIRALRRQRFDAALDMQGLLRSALVARASGGRVFGPAWAREGATLLYGTRLPVPHPHQAHAVERAGAFVRQVLQALGLPAPAGELPPARLPPGLCGPGVEAGPPRLVLLPGAGKPANRPTPGLLASVADRCQRAVPALEVVVVGGPSDREAAARVVAGCRDAKPRSLCGVSLRESAACLRAAAVVVGGDTGPLHLARALGRPVVGLFHAADPARTGPRGLPADAGSRVFAGQAPCAPCCRRECNRPQRVRICVETLEVDEVADAALGLIGQGVESRP